MSDAILNREGWLTELGNRIKPLFGRYHLKPFRATCGWPSQNALGNKRRRLGECVYPVENPSGVREIFVSPLLDVSLEVAGTLVHEMAHVAAGHEAGHGPNYVKVCRLVGLTKGKPTSVMPGKLLNEKLEKLIADLGQYPHTAIKGNKRPTKPKSGTSLKCRECGCRISITFKWLGKSGNPKCGCGGEMAEGGDDE